jgi:hypothetical protein
MTTPRKFAVITSVLSAVGNLGAIAIIINAVNVSEFAAMLPHSPKVLFLLVAGLLSLIISFLLLLQEGATKRFQLAALVVSAVVFIVAAFQMSITLLFVLFWPWSLYRLYRE